MKRMLIYTAILLLCWNYVCAENLNTSEHANQTDFILTTPAQFKGIAVLETDRMIMKKNLLGKRYKRQVVFKDIKYSFKEAAFLFDLADEKTKNYYQKKQKISC